MEGGTHFDFLARIIAACVHARGAELVETGLEVGARLYRSGGVVQRRSAIDSAKGDGVGDGGEDEERLKCFGELHR